MKVYNMLTNKKEEFAPFDGKTVKMYACGITASGDAHLGHAFQALVYDVISKYLRDKGYGVTYARNYTDIDDRIIERAKQRNMKELEYVEMMIKKTDGELKRFGLTFADLEVRATEHIDTIIEIVQKLIDIGYAYVDAEGSVYYRTAKFDGYGKLSNRKLDEMLDGVRKQNSETKENFYDFALWKAAKEGEVSWDSPWGKGRPGWHIECSAMNYKNFGEQVDIHGGGMDLVFPHHENEIAQIEPITKKQFVKYWIHNGLVKINGQKMSKSLGNGISIDEALNRWHREAIKFGFLQTNYKKDIDITDNLFPDAEKHLYNFYKVFKEIEEKFKSLKGLNKKIFEEFNSAMDNDFNTAETIGNLFGYLKVMQGKIASGDESVIEDYNSIKDRYKILGLLQENCDDYIKYYEDKYLNSEVPSEVKKLADERVLAKKNKNFAESDRLRGEIEKLGFIVKDTREGYELTKKQ